MLDFESVVNIIVALLSVKALHIVFWFGSYTGVSR